MSDTYTTPEGFTLYRPLFFPDARRLEEILTPVRPWVHATMTSRNGVEGPEAPELIQIREETWVDPFCSLRNMPEQPMYVSIQVLPSDAVLEMIAENMVFSSRISFEVIYHVNNDRCLVLAQGDIGVRYLAYVAPDSVRRSSPFRLRRP